MTEAKDKDKEAVKCKADSDCAPLGACYACDAATKTCLPSLGTTIDCLACDDACTDDGNACTGAPVCDPVLGCQHPLLADGTTCTTSAGTSGFCQAGFCTEGVCTEYWAECDYWDDADAWRRDCALCEAQGGEMCGFGFSDAAPLCCPTGEVCHRSRICCPIEKVCGMDCCGPTGQCVMDPNWTYCTTA